MINDQQIVSDILLGGRAKERAITTLWENLETKVLAIVMTKGNSREDAEEALSDGVFLFCEMVESGKYEDGKIEALVTTLAVRAAISR